MRPRQRIPSGEIRGYFTIDRMPAGEAPEALRAKWVECLLPMRYELKPGQRRRFRGMGVETKTLVSGDDGVWILSSDAITALDRSGASDAAAYWEVKMAAFPPALIFNASEGRLLSIEEAQAIDPTIGDAFED
jgi:hypothetical protein